MISDLDGSLGSRYLLNVANERTCFANLVLRVSHLTIPGSPGSGKMRDPGNKVDV